MKEGQPRTIYLADYEPPAFWIDETHLRFELWETHTIVRSTLSIRRNQAEGQAARPPLRLDGVELELLSLSLDGKALKTTEYLISSEKLTIPDVPDAFELECITRIRPQDNTSLEGLYKSRGMFCTQCEAEGFRKITYFLDRPDVMSLFTTEIEADAAQYPVLLSNGNNIEQRELASGRKLAVWQDPFRKPSYLFALVAGDLACITDQFITCSGRKIELRMYVESKDLDKCEHALRSLKKAMRWDEQVFGREYDLDVFMIVAVDDFNMGAMENKGLNIFNTSCVLANPETTTDLGFQRVEAIVAHEYFHNWSGNRVTCRDWFQLSLKEGFTVFRDAEFSSDMGSRTVKRVEDVALLRTAQFAEDAGPMAHPVRPASYMEISNFYTVTVYEKGAEVVRMLHTLLGQKDFRAGSDLYFERHDGQAVTTDDFVQAMEEASGKDLSQFRRWYSQAGTPQLHITGAWDAESSRYTLTIQQSCEPTPGQEDKQPFHIPVAVSLLGDAGKLALTLRDSAPESNAERADNTEVVLNLTEAEQEFVFENLPERPVPSLLRGFSAPVKMHYDYSDADLLFLMQRDDDGFARWDASQTLALRELKRLVKAYQNGDALQMDSKLVDAYRAVLADEQLDRAMVSMMLSLPSEAYIAEVIQPVDVHAIHACREFARREIARSLEAELVEVYESNAVREVYQPEAGQIARRALRNTCLTYLALIGSEAQIARCELQFANADNMTDTYAALRELVVSKADAAQLPRQKALDAFYQRWQHESLVLNQWLQVQASAQLPNGLATVKQLLQHPAYDAGNPNKVRAVVGAFCGQNLINFHNPDGSGYEFLADQVLELNERNPQIAARLLGPLSKWRKYTLPLQEKMQQALQRIAASDSLSKDVYEVVSKSLQ